MRIESVGIPVVVAVAVQVGGTVAAPMVGTVAVQVAVGNSQPVVQAMVGWWFVDCLAEKVRLAEAVFELSDFAELDLAEPDLNEPDLNEEAQNGSPRVDVAELPCRWTKAEMTAQRPGGVAFVVLALAVSPLGGLALGRLDHCKSALGTWAFVAAWEVPVTVFDRSTKIVAAESALAVRVRGLVGRRKLAN